ncbi:MAG: tRNA-(ms[2]io[6]A)-hydroxylase [Chitinophagales bacterium]|nr:tRNA-(ms[2]io[6]A)-hydroxylase [Chitinophagales bacterium]MCO5279692.1 tRNA-(ms[2]io[6]A)-hydroxylase [Chitinophagales bacterium]OJV29158.1 MAG: tRNA 2-methylthio-N6-isopentenyl adenosine(37) hydroxylase MiaE [Bacteroidetes bacterium 37-13]HRN93512.1 tRNA-(ms[2]io[6]A)-hydroxylase [Chitinophagales bacterium]HRP40179.1 tRNA-(ms[2]io[6]A)-hydroxylase [Chitinophagales bacterium]
MLGLKLPTDPRWVNLAEKSIEEILTDHAYCEQKATSTSISLIQNYPEFEEMVEALIPIVSEEWGHFKMVLEQLKKRGLKLGIQRKDKYVNALQKFLKKGDSRKNSLIEKLLFSALIEARSCERFKLLSKEINDEELRDFYKKLMVSEAGHYKLFLDMACNLGDKEKVLQRWEEWLHYEAEVMQNLSLRGDRIH